jgi:hypothetical protein
VARQISGPRKQRTRQHVIADLSVNHVERFIIEEGHTVGRLGSDYGYDLVMMSHDEQGYPEPGSAYFQLKAAETLQVSGGEIVFDLDIRDYNLWMDELMPVFLVLFDASRRRAYWLFVQDFFREDPSRRPKMRAKTVRVRVPVSQVINRRGVARIRALKQEACRRMKRG